MLSEIGNHLNDDELCMSLKLVRTAIYLFARHGYYGASLADIASHCNIKKPSIFHYYPSKNALCLRALEVLQCYCRQYVFSKDYSGSNINKFAKAVENFFQPAFDNIYIGLLPAMLLGVNPDLDRQVKCYFDEWVRITNEVFADYICQSKRFKSARDIVVQLYGALTLAKVYGDFEYVRRFCRKLTKLITEKE